MDTELDNNVVPNFSTESSEKSCDSEPDKSVQNFGTKSLENCDVNQLQNRSILLQICNEARKL